MAMQEDDTREDDAGRPGEADGHRPSRAQRRAARWQRRVERYEARRTGPPPPRRLHRAAVLVVMMAAMLVLVALMAFGPSGSGPRG